MSQASQIWYYLNKVLLTTIWKHDKTATSFTPLISQLSPDICHLANNADNKAFPQKPATRPSFKEKCVIPSLSPTQLCMMIYQDLSTAVGKSLPSQIFNLRMYLLIFNFSCIQLVFFNVHRSLFSHAVVQDHFFH